MKWLRRLWSAFAVWRISNMLVNEDGPADVFDTVRRYANRGPLSGLFSCVYCMSVWVSGAAYFRPLSGPRRAAEETLAISGLAILIHEGIKAAQRIANHKES